MMKTAVILADGFEEVEALTVVDILRRADIKCMMLSLSGKKEVTGTHGIKVESDGTVDDMDFTDFSAVILPGGMPGADHLKKSDKVIKLIKEFKEKNKLVAAICAAPIVLEEAKVTEGIDITSYPDFKDTFKKSNYKEELAVQSGNIITSRGPSTSFYFALKIVEYLEGKKEADEIRSNILLDFTEAKIRNNK